MFPISIKPNTSSFCSIALVAGLVLLIFGCASIEQQRAPQWTCDPQADAAVSRQDWEAARLGHETFLEKEPNNCLAIYHLGYITGHLGARDREIELYRQALDCGLNSSDQLYFNLGMALGDMDDLDGALDAFKKAVDLAPDNPDNHFGQGLMAQAAGQASLAEDALKQTLDLAPDHSEARLLLAQLYLDQSRWDEARFHLQAVLEASPSHPEAMDLWRTMISRQREAYDFPRP
jgi:tetratricopeptide (TPR) repeat protein